MGIRPFGVKRASRALSLVVAGVLLSPPAAVAGAEDPVPTSILVSIISDWYPTAGENTFDATLTVGSGHEPVAGAELQLLLKTYGHEEFKVVGTDTTDEHGHAVVTVNVFHNTRVKWKFAGDETRLPSTSVVYTQQMKPRVWMHLSDRSPRAGQRVVVTGDTLPAKSGHRVAVYRGHTTGGGYGLPYHPSLLDRGRIRGDGTYRLVIRFAHPGRKTVFVEVAGGDGNYTGWSIPRRAWSASLRRS